MKFFLPAFEGKNEFWRYFVMIFLVIIAYFVGQIPYTVMLLIWGSKNGINFTDTQQMMEAFPYKNLQLLGLLLSFIVGLLVLCILMKPLHDRHWKTLVNYAEKIRWKRFFFSFVLWFAIVALIEVAHYFFDPQNYIFQFEPEKFLPLLIIGFVFLPLQTTFEEFFVRGYLMQAFGRIVVFPVLSLILTSAIFAIMHASNPEVSQFGANLLMPYYFGVGVVLALITIMDDGLELAMGFHASNNIFSAVFVTFSGSALPTPALFKLKELDPMAMNLVSLLGVTIFIAIVAIKYNWNNWGKLLNRVEKPKYNVNNELNVQEQSEA